MAVQLQEHKGVQKQTMERYYSSRRCSFYRQQLEDEMHLWLLNLSSQSQAEIFVGSQEEQRDL
uniref:Uncharacterized protein n=1 Tax=Oryza meridionalis TaxID=40149 RepID=A0A0E0CRC6_9ORYZ